MVGREVREDRRRQVWDMYIRGVPEGVIAQAFSVHRNTIVNDIRELRRTNRRVVDDLDVQSEIGDAVAKFDSIIKMAMTEYGTTDLPGQRNSFLGQALAALNQKLRFMMDVGILPKAVQKVEGSFTVEGINVEQASLEELKVLRNRLVERVEGPGVNRIASLS